MFILYLDVQLTNVTVISRAPMDTEEVFQVFLSTLRMHGSATVSAACGLYRIVPEQMAIGDTAVSGAGSKAFITQVFKLDSFCAVETAQTVKPLVDAQDQVVANARPNKPVTVDYASDMRRLKMIVAGLDESDRTKVETVELTNVPDREVQGTPSDLLSDRNDNPNNRFEVSASSRSNSIIVRGDGATVARAIQAARDLGVQFLLSGTGDSSVLFLSTNLFNSAPSVLQLAGATINSHVFGGTNPFTTSAVTSLVGQQGIGFGGGEQSGDSLFGGDHHRDGRGRVIPCAL